MAANPVPQKQAYYGWYVCAATMFVGFAVTGVRNGFGVFFLPMKEEFGWTHFELSAAAALGVLVNGVTQPFLGRIFDRTGGRGLVLTSIVVMATGAILMSFTFHILYLGFVFGVVISMAQSGAGPTNMAALMSRWFRRLRGTTISLNSAATSLGGLLLVPFAAYLLQATDWRTAWVGLGIVVMISLPMALLFIRRSPAERGLHPDGDPEPPTDRSGMPTKVISGPLEAERWSDSFKSAPMWQMSASYFVCGLTTFVMSVHFIPFAEEKGVSGGTAAIMFGVMMGLNIIGGLGAGYLSDKLGGTKNWLALAYLIRGVGYLLLLTVPAPLGLWVFVIFAGFSWVATPILTSSLTADVYGLRALGTISGITFMFHQFGGSASVIMAGLLHDVYGSYTVPFAIVGALLLPAAISAFSIKERKYSSRYQTAASPAAASAGD